MPIEHLEDIKGIGTKLREKLRNHFGCEKKAIEALRNAEIYSIGSIEGISGRAAVRLVRNFYSAEKGERLDDFLKTSDAIQIFDKCLQLVTNEARTEVAKSQAMLLVPLGKDQLSTIQNRQEDTHSGIELVQFYKQRLKQFDITLNRVKSFSSSSQSIDIGNRVIISPHQTVIDYLEETIVATYCQLNFIEEVTGISEYLDTEDEIIVVSDYEIGDDDSLFLVVDSDNKEDVLNFVPESAISFFAQNLDILRAIVEISSQLQECPLKNETGKFFTQLSSNSLMDFQKILSKIKSDGTVDSTIDEELNRLAKAVNQFENTLLETENSLNEKITSYLQKTTIELEGEKLLELLKAGDATERPDIRPYLNDALYEFVNEITQKACNIIIQKLNLKHEEAEFLEELFPDELVIPLEAIEEQKDKILRHLRKKRSLRELEHKIAIAKEISKFRVLSSDLLRHVFRIDYLLMLGKFSLKTKGTLPHLSADKTGLVITEGMNLWLLEAAIRSSTTFPEAISYEFGSISTDHDQRIIILSGANSGGKTTMLTMVAQMIILAHMGLSIPARNATVGLYEEFYYFKKPTGTLDAGAFETAIKMLSTMALSTKPRIILADEMESISEPGAAAKVIAAFLDLLNTDTEVQSCGIFVSHLANAIEKSCISKVRIDGIEATGLDPTTLELIVNRTPRYNHYARSTPQLIIERLAKLANKGREREVYQEILSRFQKDKNNRDVDL